MTDLRDSLTLIRDTADRALAALPVPTTPVVTVRAGENLQAALDAGGSIRLEAGATFQGNYLMRRPGTVLAGATPDARLVPLDRFFPPLTIAANEITAAGFT